MQGIERRDNRAEADSGTQVSRTACWDILQWRDCGAVRLVLQIANKGTFRARAKSHGPPNAEVLGGP